MMPDEPLPLPAESCEADGMSQLPPLEGTPNQVEWATTIRRERLAALRAFAAQRVPEIRKALVATIIADIARREIAAWWWIDHRRDTPAKLVYDGYRVPAHLMAAAKLFIRERAMLPSLWPTTSSPPVVVALPERLDKLLVMLPDQTEFAVVRDLDWLTCLVDLREQGVPDDGCTISLLPGGYNLFLAFRPQHLAQAALLRLRHG